MLTIDRGALFWDELEFCSYWKAYRLCAGGLIVLCYMIPPQSEEDPVPTDMRGFPTEMRYYQTCYCISTMSLKLNLRSRLLF